MSGMTKQSKRWTKQLTAARQVQQLSLSFVGPLKRRQKERLKLIGSFAFFL